VGGGGSRNDGDVVKHPHRLTVEFSTSRLLSQEQLDALVAAVISQVEEPPAPSIYLKRAEYETHISKCAVDTGYFTSTYVNENAPADAEAAS